MLCQYLSRLLDKNKYRKKHLFPSKVVAGFILLVLFDTLIDRQSSEQCFKNCYEFID